MPGVPTPLFVAEKPAKSRPFSGSTSFSVMAKPMVGSRCIRSATGQGATPQTARSALEQVVTVLLNMCLPGCRELTASNTGKFIAISLWETEADATATGEGSAYVQEQFAKLAQAVAGQPTLEQYEVSVQV